MRAIVNTHLHCDHCGGNAAVQRAFGAPVFTPPGQAQAVRRWDEVALSYTQVWSRVGQAESATPADWGEALLGELVASGAARRVGGRVFAA